MIEPIYREDGTSMLVIPNYEKRTVAVILENCVEAFADKLIQTLGGEDSICIEDLVASTIKDKYVGVARCNESDEFDIAFATRLAANRANAQLAIDKRDSYKKLARFHKERVARLTRSLDKAQNSIDGLREDRATLVHKKYPHED